MVALGNLEGKIKRFLKGDGAFGLTYSEIVKELKEKRLSYTGEEVSQPHELTVDQIEKGLPPVGHGGSVDMLPFLKGRAKHLLLHPEECLLPAGQRLAVPATAKVHIKKGEEKRVFELLRTRGVIEWREASEAYQDEGGEYLSGMFGVVKPNKTSAEGNPVLRCIMNLVPVNSLFSVIEADIGCLPSATLWQTLVIADGEEIRMSQSDMACAFYLFLLPKVWRRYMMFNYKCKGEELGLSKGIWYRPAVRVLPMGWSSSVGLMQCMSRELLLQRGMPPHMELKKTGRLPVWFSGSVDAATNDKAWYQVYLDNFFAGEVTGAEDKWNRAFLKEAAGAWKEAGVLTAPEKDVINTTWAVELGVRIEGQEGLLGSSPERMLKTCLASIYLLEDHLWSKKLCQVILGRWIFILQFRRAAMGVLSRSWEALDTWLPSPPQKKRLREELTQLLCLAPLLQADLTNDYDDEITCSDASETGGAAARASGLSWSGQSYVSIARNPILLAREAPIVVLSLFNGIGGAFRVYDVLGINVMARISADISRDANRCSRTAWPDMEEWHDVDLINEEVILGWANRYGRARELHLWAGFPCIHLSSVRAFRRNLSGEGSALFWRLLEILGMVQRIFGTFCRVKFCVENVSSMDAEARRTISEHLEVAPVKVDPSDTLPMSRPRLGWCSEPVYAMENLELWQEGDVTRAYVSGASVETRQWIRPGWSWPSEESGVAFPTFMKCIRRRVPPPFPAGLERTDEATRERWKASSFAFPPYQFKEKFLLTAANHEPRLLDASERELLLGYGPGHTATCKSASEAKQSYSAFEDSRLSLCGDSFAISSFAIFGATLCQDLFPRMNPAMIIKRLGLAPGASAHPDLEVPMTRWLNYGGSTTESHGLVEMNRCLGLTVNHTGSDVRVLSGTVLGKGSGHASVRAFWWQWKNLFSVKWISPQHINFLEMKMILLTLLWKCRNPRAVGRRWLHLEDSMVCLYILSKGRTSSHLLQPLTNQIGALQLAMGATLAHAHVGSAENPTDRASRR